MRPKARGLAQHGGPPGWLKESDLAGVILYALLSAISVLYRLPWQKLPSCEQMGISSCCNLVNVHNHPSWATSRTEGMALYSSRHMPSLWLWLMVEGGGMFEPNKTTAKIPGLLQIYPLSRHFSWHFEKSKKFMIGPGLPWVFSNLQSFYLERFLRPWQYGGCTESALRLHHAFLIFFHGRLRNLQL